MSAYMLTSPMILYASEDGKIPTLSTGNSHTKKEIRILP